MKNVVAAKLVPNPCSVENVAFILTDNPHRALVPGLMSTFPCVFSRPLSSFVTGVALSRIHTESLRFTSTHDDISPLVVMGDEHSRASTSNMSPERRQRPQ